MKSLDSLYDEGSEKFIEDDSFIESHTEFFLKITKVNMVKVVMMYTGEIVKSLGDNCYIPEGGIYCFYICIEFICTMDCINQDESPTK